MKIFLLIGVMNLSTGLLFAQCPVNINFASKDLSGWGAYTGNLAYRPNSIQQIYPANTPPPLGTTGVSVIQEYGLAAPGISVNTVNRTDPFGFFETIPTINGYSYNYSVLLGSTNVTSRSDAVRGGYIRGISYTINVPAGPPSVPYTITYAYAMVLENGSHATNNQPVFTATVSAPGGSIACASAFYNLPTIFAGIVNTNGGPDSSFVLDENIAAQQGFSLSSVPSPNQNGNFNESPFRVFTKGWREVTFNLAPYRGQQVTLTFEADNCVPGGHFSYAYIALRNDCGGLEISGPNPACINTTATYSIPSIANASYTWTVPPGWQIISSANTNIISVKPGNNGGIITVTGNNGCTNLNASLAVTSSPPTIAGGVTPDVAVCTGNNSTTLRLTGNSGRVIKWIASTDGINWNDIGNANTSTYTAVNLVQTTYYKTLVQNGSNCNIDSSTAALISVFEKSVGGNINPSFINICLNQNKDANLFLTGKKGNIINWQWSDDNVIWNNFNPVLTDSIYNIKNQITPVRYYRAIVQVGVCPPAFSSASKVTLINVPFPKASISPPETTICFGDTASLTTNIITGSSYEWLNTSNLSDPNNNQLPSIPYTFTAFASPPLTTYYPISIINNGCPNALVDTFTVNVRPQIFLSAGPDMFIVAGQPLQLTAQINNPGEYSFQWAPATGLSDATIYNPIANLGTNIETIIYKVTATDNIAGCTEGSTVKVTVFKTGPDIFVPTAFTPNKDNLNDILKPIPVGITKMEFFKVYNRYGQLIYSTTTVGKGWDGTINGKSQPQGVYVWTAKAISYTGTSILKKGTTTLIR